MLSISTSWMAADASISDWLTQVKALGVGAIELSYRVSHTQLEEVVVGLNRLNLRVSSIHNFCPTPNDGPTTRHVSNYYRLSSIDEVERQLAVKWTKAAIDTAQRVGAQVVVIHAGQVDCDDERSIKLFDLFTDGRKDTPAFADERGRILRLRDKQRAPFIEALERSLGELTGYANTKGVKIGLETRYYPLEIPNFDEIGYFLKKFDKSVVGYWHDVGHAEMNSRLGIKPHLDFLTFYQDRLIGVHIHGMLGRRDHLAPFEGDFDLNPWLPFFGDPVIRVIESKPVASAEMIKAALPNLI